MAPHGLGQVEIDQGITAEHHEGLVEEALEILNLFEATGRSEGVADQLAILNAAFKAVGNLDAKTLAIPEVVLDLLGQVGDIHHDFREAMLL